VRNFKWYQQYNAKLKQAGSLSEVLASNTGELYFFNGRSFPVNHVTHVVGCCTSFVVPTSLRWLTAMLREALVHQAY
jgi:hypothetical protein